MKNRAFPNKYLKIFLIITGGFILKSCAVYYPGYQSSLPVDDILKMSKEGVSSKNIIKQIKESHSVYRLPASELAKLSREGVQDSVINYMERTRINDVRRNSMYYDPYYGYGGMFGYPWYGLWYSPRFGWPYSYGYWDYAPRIVIRSGNEFHGGERSGRRH